MSMPRLGNRETKGICLIFAKLAVVGDAGYIPRHVAIRRVRLAEQSRYLGGTKLDS